MYRSYNRSQFFFLPLLSPPSRQRWSLSRYSGNSFFVWYIGLLRFCKCLAAIFCYFWFTSAVCSLSQRFWSGDQKQDSTTIRDIEATVMSFLTGLLSSFHIKIQARKLPSFISLFQSTVCFSSSFILIFWIRLSWNLTRWNVMSW